MSGFHFFSSAFWMLQGPSLPKVGLLLIYLCEEEKQKQGHHTLGVPNGIEYRWLLLPRKAFWWCQFLDQLGRKGNEWFTPAQVFPRLLLVDINYLWIPMSPRSLTQPSESTFGCGFPFWTEGTRFVSLTCGTGALIALKNKGWAIIREHPERSTDRLPFFFLKKSKILWN